MAPWAKREKGGNDQPWSRASPGYQPVLVDLLRLSQDFEFHNGLHLAKQCLVRMARLVSQLRIDSIDRLLMQPNVNKSQSDELQKSNLSNLTHSLPFPLFL